MLLYWKFLLVLGTLLWAALCLSDYTLSSDNIYNTYLSEDTSIGPEIDIEELDYLSEFLKNFIDLKKYISFCEDYYIALVFQWIAVSFLCTIVFCLTGKIIVNYIAYYQLKARMPSKVPRITLKPPEAEIVASSSSQPAPSMEQAPILNADAKTSDSNLKKTSSASKIPVLVARHEAQSPLQESVTKDSSTAKNNEDINKSCPDLSSKASITKNKILFSLYDNNIIRSSRSADRLRDEIVMLQATSFREQAILSRKLEAIVEEKRHLSIALANSLKENKSAKRKLEEIQRERSILLMQLESATNEIKSNTKSKKLTLNRLEKAIGESKEMKSEFTRLNDEKKKLEERVISLDSECNQMKIRRSALNKSYSEIKHDYDGDNIMHDKTDEESLTSGGYYEVTDKQLNQSNIDMNKVQTKLNDLEKSLEKLKFSSTITKERERSLKEDSSITILSDEASYDMMGENQIDEDDDDEDTIEAQNANYNNADATAITSVSSLDIDDCQSLCLMPGCSRDHSICENPACVLEHLIEEEHSPENEHRSSDGNLDLDRVTSTNQFILEAVKEKSAVMANRSSLFDTKEARARLAAFFSVSLWKKTDKVTCNAIPTVSDDKLSTDSDYQQTEFDLEDWSPRLVPAGVVSQSPAFQKFLSNVILDQRNAMMEQRNIETG